MAQIENPQKGYMFAILAAGLNSMAVQQAVLPDKDFDQVEHFELGSKIKTPGIENVGNLRLTNIVPLGIGDNWLTTWINQVRNRFGTGLPPSLLKRNIDIAQYDYDWITITQLWEIRGAWPQKVNGRELDKSKSDNSVDDLELSVDKFTKTRG